MVVTLGRLATDNGLLLDMGVNDIASTVFLIIGEGEPKYIGPAWSLQFELLFYVIFCGLLINGRIGGLLMIGWAAILLGQIFDLFQLSLPYGIGSPFCVEFLSGVAVGLLARKYPLSASKSMLGWALLAFMAGVVFDVYGPLGRHTGIGRLVLGLASALILTVLVGLENRRALRTPSWLVRIGSVSYSIYLGHILFINMTFMILLKLGIYHALPEIVVFSIGLGVALTLTILIGLHVEIPVVNRLKNYKAAVKAG
jgi:peptidoglycan/LPS O-acetylase OafA/YrhL